jgi:hypothetical protein
MRLRVCIAERCSVCSHWGAFGKAKVRHVHMCMWEQDKVRHLLKLWLVQQSMYGTSCIATGTQVRGHCTLVTAVDGVIRVQAYLWQHCGRYICTDLMFSKCRKPVRAGQALVPTLHPWIQMWPSREQVVKQGELQKRQRRPQGLRNLLH